jgi:hypothetical protein
MQDKDNKSSFRLWHAFAATAALLIITFCSYTAARAYDFKKTQDAVPLSAEAVYDLNEILCAQYPEEHQVLKKLPYNIGQPQLDIWAKAAILIDVSNGNILYEKNAGKIKRNGGKVNRQHPGKLFFIFFGVCVFSVGSERSEKTVMPEYKKISFVTQSDSGKTVIYNRCHQNNSRY